MYNKTQSIQLVAVGGANNIIQVSAFGKFHCSLNAVWYKNNNNQESIIQLKSPQFRLKYPSGANYSVNGVLTNPLSAQTYPCFVSTASHQIGGLNGAIEWDVELQGTIELQLVSIKGNAIDVDDYCVMNINLSPLLDAPL
jgi:hypothetical protein